MRFKITISAISLILTTGCTDLLDPTPVDRIVNELVVTDAPSARVTLTSAYRSMANLSTPKIIAGDLTADNLKHNGTFTQYLEISNKDMSAANGSASSMWGVIYSIAYTVNFVLEGLETLDNIDDATKNELEAIGRFLRGYGYFAGVTTFGGLPIVTTTEIEANRNIPRSDLETTLRFIEEDLLFALDKLPENVINAGELSNGAVKAALARFYLYQEDWDQAELYATDVIEGNGTENYFLEENFEDLLADFNSESILEIVYTANDNPGTSTDFSISNLFVTRREIIPSNEIVEALQDIGGARINMIEFDRLNSIGSDNGWTITRYGPFDNIPVFRLAEMYLIRAEARAQKNNINGENSAQSDLNIIRARAGTSLAPPLAVGEMLLAIERERQVELAFEGHRWYDLKRTGRAQSVMERVTNNWTEKDELWPVPLREIQNNPALQGAQNPGY
jgi:hypothetical protein